MATIKDEAHKDALKGVNEAYHSVVIAEAEARRGKVRELIRAISVLDTKILIFRSKVDLIRENLSQEGVDGIDAYLKTIEEKRNMLLLKKKQFLY